MKDESLIPEGMCCHDYDDTGKVCPYWRSIPDRHEQENGWCDYLEKGDVEIKKEQIFSNSCPPVFNNTGQLVDYNHLLISLLWDQCKECNINLGDGLK